MAKKNLFSQLSKNFERSWDDFKKNPSKALNNLFTNEYKGSDNPVIDAYRKGFIDSSVSSIQDPLFSSFGLKFEFFPRIGDEDSLEPGLLSGYARKYLESRGDTQRVIKLDYFTRMLQRISVEEPWFFQKITGVGSLFNVNLNSGFRVKDDVKLTVNVLETINMRIISMMEAYRDIVYDKRFMRDMLPGNLKKFDMSVYITDPRLLYEFKDGKRQYSDDNQGVIVLKLLDCSFEFDSFGNSFSDIDNANIDTMINPSFSIKVGRVNEKYNLPTRELFGYGGNGYFSDDYIDDYNFLLNLIRPPSMNYAEAGNERRITLFSNRDLETLKRKINEFNFADKKDPKPPTPNVNPPSRTSGGNNSNNRTTDSNIQNINNRFL